MSQELVELTRSTTDAFNRRDLQAMLAAHHPEVEFTPFERAVEGLGPYRGHAGIREWWEDAFVALPDLRNEIAEVRDLGSVVLSRGRLLGKGAGSGASFDREVWMAVEWRDGKVVWWHAFATEDEALETIRQRSGH